MSNRLIDRQINMTLTLNSLNPDCVAVHKTVSPSAQWSNAFTKDGVIEKYFLSKNI